MDISTILTLFGFGITLGIAVSIMGGLLDYWRFRQHKESGGSVMLLVAGIGNTAAGIIAIVLSFLWSQSIWPALITGLAVFIGFSIGFLVIASLWIFVGS